MLTLENATRSNNDQGKKVEAAAKDLAEPMKLLVWPGAFVVTAAVGAIAYFNRKRVLDIRNNTLEEVRTREINSESYHPRWGSSIIKKAEVEAILNTASPKELRRMHNDNITEYVTVRHANSAKELDT